MRRLLWGTKKDVSAASQSTDGIEIEKCNINVTNGKWTKRESEIFLKFLLLFNTKYNIFNPYHEY